VKYPPEIPSEDQVLASTSTNTSKPISFFFSKIENIAEKIYPLSNDLNDEGEGEDNDLSHKGRGGTIFWEERPLPRK
jgi:hypothetical protein